MLHSRPHAAAKRREIRRYYTLRREILRTMVASKASAHPAPAAPILEWIRWRDEYTFRCCRFDRVRDSVYVVSPGTTFAILAVASLAIFAVSVEIRCSCAPTTVLNSEDDHFPLPGDLVALVDGICSCTVASTDSRVGTFDLGYSTAGSVLPASEIGVC